MEALRDKDYVRQLRSREAETSSCMIEGCWQLIFTTRSGTASPIQESESEDDGLDMGDDDDVEEPENEPEAVRKEPTIEKLDPVSAPPKDAERQLSKKELKKKTRSNWSKVVKGRKKKVLVLLQRIES
ncbi:uncharacterized protein LOC122024643 [Zingiber officinale]|uniref:uncharacterized protein LOC122024643 n=1 Tax=Zingiber officinale TaxID=94328 RepID=UPI001C4AA25F|nr:uncharacterized protein LOC122024643 [Zingiber officinale]